MARAVQRLLAQKYDCPTTLDAASRRIGGVLVAPKDVYERMSSGERQECDREGNSHAVERVRARLEALPSGLAKSLAGARAYLARRQALIVSQCEADLDTMREARGAYVSAQIASTLTDEDFYWDLSRVSTADLLSELEHPVSGEGFSLTVRGQQATQSSPPMLQIEAMEKPDTGTTEFGWSQKTFILEDSYGPPRVAMSQVVGAVSVPEVGLDPLPLENKVIAASWEREPHGNVSVGDVSGSWLASEGFRYCRHEINVYSDNNVCDNTVTVTDRGVTVKATLKSGSKYVDGWRGWLRFRGQLTSISKTATRCQVQRAECRSGNYSAQLVDIDPICEAGPGSHQDTEFEDLCFREGSPGRETCHYGTVGGDGRCRVTRIVACPF